MWTRCYRDFVMVMLDDLAASCIFIEGLYAIVRCVWSKSFVIYS